ncbi:NUDIX hydrolase [Nocardiopsis metallicus]|uniref:8-oxo-dGTP pyrophosphatase MutT (NUDIX family) n=1 Tax=Nocardiopsis metallicus TaxID=179819 RepID=A0A840WCT6_9ACTN|nr:8-oxo-dGTP pyrophosphatase MutT (NUDIX family) [Nocardiopsis metallicus]
MNAPRPTPVRKTVALLVGLTDGSIVVDSNGSLPAAELPPEAACTPVLRHLRDRLSLANDTAPHLAVVDSTDDETVVHHVVWHGLLPAPRAASARHHSVPLGQALRALPEQEAARLRAACRAGLLGQTLYLAQGRRPDAAPTKTERTLARFTWNLGTSPPSAQDIHQVWGWLTDSLGRVLILLDRFGTPSLPGGRPEPGESPHHTLAREAVEEANAHTGASTMLGFQQVKENDRAPYTQLRMTAPLHRLGPAEPDPDSGQTYRRVLVPARQANLLLGWGPEGDAQAAAVADSCCALPLAPLVHVPHQGWNRRETDQGATTVSEPIPRPRR